MTTLPNRRDGVTIPRIWITLGLSVLLHVLVMWQVKPQVKPGDFSAEKGERYGLPLNVQIVPPARPRPPVLALRPSPVPPPPPPPPAPRRPQVHEAPRRAAPARPSPAPLPPPVIARSTPAPEAPIRVPERPAPPPSPPAATPKEDFAAALEARRRARGEATSNPAAPLPFTTASAPSAATGEDPRARAQRLAELNLGTNRKPTFGEKKPGGGVFTLRYRSYDYAEYLFYGWNQDIRRDTAQVIQVRKGNDPDIRIAVVRSMIGIIRQYEQGDFTWESPRLNRVVTKSARPKDTADLEQFLLLEFFENDHRPIGSQ